MRYDIILFGLNHRTADVDIRECFALADPGIFAAKLVSESMAIRESLVLSTCNRVECLVVADIDCEAEDDVLAIWAKHVGKSAGKLQPHLYIHRNLEAVRHIFRVSAGLDSMVLGEPQILGQLKQAYQSSVESGTAKVIVNRLLHKAFFVAKRVRTETGIGASAVSISYAAVELAKRIFGEMKEKRAMLIGAGEMAELAATHLIEAGVKDILVCNRTYSRAEELATRFRGRPAPFDELLECLAQADIVISSTGAIESIIRAKDMRRVMKQRKYRPMFFIDIAVPRDIDPDVNNLDNVYLYDIDDLKEVVEENIAKRRDEAEKAEEIIGEQVGNFETWLASLDLQPTIVDLLKRGDEIAEKELGKTLKRLGPDISDETRQALEALAYSISHKIFHDPMMFLKRRAVEDETGERFLDVTRRMFNLDNENVPEDAHKNRRHNKN